MMTPEELKHFRSLLENLDAEIRSRLAGGAPTRDSITPDNAIGRLTRMEAIQAEQISAAGRRQMNVRLQQIRRALDQLDQGTYGRCVRCGEAIPRGRLEVMPESHLCITCASRPH